MMNEVEKFKERFFNLPSRGFGESYVQPILYIVLGDAPYNKGNEVDAFRPTTGEKGEYKAIRVVFENDKNKSTLYDSVMGSESMSDRIGSLKDIEDGKIVANCQNIKLNEFDYLVYVLVDDYGFHIFEISAEDFKEFANKKQFPNWSPNHGRMEKGKNGQFPIKGENLQWHFQHCFKKRVPWEEIMDISKTIAAYYHS